MRARRLVLLAGLAAAVTAPVAAADPAPTPGVLIIDTIAGNGKNGDTGDGGPATKAELRWPRAVAVDPAGSVYLQQQGSSSITDTVRKVDAKGVITTLAGAGRKPPTTEGIPVAESDLYGAYRLVADKAGNVYIVSLDPKDEKARLYQVYDGGQKIRTFAGGGSTAVADGVLATEAALELPRGLAVNDAGDVFISNMHRVLKIDHATHRISVVAGTGADAPYDPVHEGKAAKDVPLKDVDEVAVDKAGNLYLTDPASDRLRKVSHPDGTIRTAACGGSEPLADGIPAAKAKCHADHLAVSPAGVVYFTIYNESLEYSDSVVLTIDADQKLGRAVGTTPGFGGDGGKAAEAKLTDVEALAFNEAGDMYIADSGNHRIRKVTKVAAPVAKDDSLNVEPGKDVKGNVLANDTGTTLKVSANTDPKNGTLTIGPDGAVSYKPKDGFTGDDSFGYTVTDPYGQQASAKVTIAVKTGGTAPAPQGSSGGLAATGASVVGLTAAAVGLLGLGGGLIAFTARRRRRRSA